MLAASMMGFYHNLSDLAPDPHLALTCWMRFRKIPCRFVCGLFRIGPDAGRINDGPCHNLSDPISIPYMAVQCWVRLDGIPF